MSQKLEIENVKWTKNFMEDANRKIGTRLRIVNHIVGEKMLNEYGDLRCMIRVRN